MKFTILVNGPVYGTQNAISAWLFCKTLLKLKYTLNSIFFYREGVLNANKFYLPPDDEFNLIKNWVFIKNKYKIPLYVCISSGLRRGIVKEKKFNTLKREFELVGLNLLSMSILQSQKFVQF